MFSSGTSEAADSSENWTAVTEKSNKEFEKILSETLDSPGTKLKANVQGVFSILVLSLVCSGL